MLFNSLDFIVFIVLFFAAWPLMRQRNNLRWTYLVAASFVFYGWWDWRFLFLIIASGLIDFLAGLAMMRFPHRKKALLIASIVGNVGSLATFKYLDFFIGNINWLFGSAGMSREIPLAGLALPIGISFYTFQSMSYTIDVYRGSLKPTRNILHFFAYLAMFPQLVAGPIVRASSLLPQLEHANPTTEQQRYSGLELIAVGFFKKVVVADSLAVIINTAFDANTVYASSLYWWVIMVMFAFQIYCDFSGYSDIARGLARWMGYQFSVNFDHPYIASSFREFWTRWHISLSTWFRDYVYLLLGGSRKGRGAAYRNMWITMLISGLWHGAAWHFFFWGVLHAGYLSIERLTHWPDRLATRWAGRHLATLITFLLVVCAWVPFRAESLGQTGHILATMFSFKSVGIATVVQRVGIKSMLLVAIMMARQLVVYLNWPPTSLETRYIPPLARPIFIAMLLVACVYLRGPSAAFVYFQF